MKTSTNITTFDGIFGDRRLDKRCQKFMAALASKCDAVINSAFDSHKERIGSYRFINNKSWDMDMAISKLTENCRGSVPEGGHVLCLQDTSEFTYGPTKGRMGADDPDMGPTSKESSMGFMLHPTLVVDADTLMPVGFSSVLLWNRSADKGSKLSRAYKELPVEQKESYKWQRSLEQSDAALAGVARKTSVSDRESDIYSHMEWQLLNGWDFVLRVRCDRITGEQGRVFETMAQSPVVAEYKIQVGGRKNRKPREATMELRFQKITIANPDKSRGGQIEVCCVYTTEKASSVPEGEEPICWLLYTSHEVGSVEQALQVVKWYSLRWLDEELFRVLKSEGMRLEDVQLETGEGVKKLTVLCLQAALNIMQLKLAYDNSRTDISVERLFTPVQMKVLGVLARKHEGRTQKQKNPFAPGSLAWASWIIARAGGWSGYASQGKPGYITISKGFRKFNYLCDYTQLLTNDDINVYKE